MKEITENKTNIYLRALALAVPMMVQNGVTNAVMLVDNLMVGTLGTESITAVAVVTQIIFVFNLAIFGAISGPGIYCAQFYGQKNSEGFGNVFRLKLLVCFLVFLIGLAIFIFGGPQLIGMFVNGSTTGINNEVTLGLGLQYLYAMLWGFLPFCITQVYASSLRETEESVIPMVSGLAAVVADIVFNYLLIFGKFGFPCWGVKGAAVATVISRLVEMAVLLVWIFIRKKRFEYVTSALNRLSFRFSGMKTVLVKSLPMFLNEFLWAAGFALTFQAYSLRGVEVVAALNIANAIFNVMIVLIFAMGSSTGIIIGQMLGASEFDEARNNAFKLTGFNGCLGAFLMLIMLCFTKYFPSCYETSEQVRSLAGTFIIVNAIYLPFCGILNSLYFTLRSGGKTFVTFFFDGVFSIVVACPVALILARYSSLDIVTLYAIVQSLDIIKITIGYFMVKKGVWISSLVSQ